MLFSISSCIRRSILHEAYKVKQFKICSKFHVASTLFDIKIVKTPQFPDSVAEGDVRWEKKKGDHVEEDEIVLEIETDKTSIPVPAPGHGIIMETFVANGGLVKPGQDLFSIDVTGIPPVREPAKPKLVPKK